MQKIDRKKYVLFTISLGLLLMNVFLIIQNLQLRKTIELSVDSATQPGFRFSDIALKGLVNNETLNLNDGQHKTLLLYFSSNCVYCKQQSPVWLEMASKVDVSKWQILLVTREKNAETVSKFLKENGLESIKVLRIDPKDASEARMNSTPMSVTVDENGEVKKVLTGLHKIGEFDSLFADVN